MDFMSESYKRHVPERVETVQPLGGPSKPAKPAALGPSSEAKSAERRDRDGKPREIGGPSGPEPTRYGDWEINGRCIDF